MLLSPAGGPGAYYAEHGFVGGDAGADLALPTADTLWTAETQGPLTQSSPVTLTYDNGKGLKFTRTIAVDDKYMFTIDDKVANTGSEPVTLYPYALVSRHETPHVQGFYILHEGLIGVVDEAGSRRSPTRRRSRTRRPSSRASTAGSASPTNIGRPWSSPSRARPSTPNSPARRPTAATASRPTT